jgi:hypothetical protein
VHQIIAIVLGDFERFSFDAVVETLENIARQVLAIIDAAIHYYKLFKRRFLLDARIVKARVENDNGERQDITGIWKDKNKKTLKPPAAVCVIESFLFTRVGEDVWVELAISLSECFHHPVNLLSFAR